MLQRPWRLLMRQAPYQIILPTLAAVAMLGASWLPWLSDPLGDQYTAWQLQVDPGWPVHSSLLNYGVLCLCCALLIGIIVLQTCRSVQQITAPARLAVATRRYSIAALCCLLPAMFFLLQYLYADMGSVAQLSQHEVQAMLIRSHFGYGSSAQFIPIQLDGFNPLTFHNRLALLLNQIGPGFFLTMGSAALLFGTRPLLSFETTSSDQFVLDGKRASYNPHLALVRSRTHLFWWLGGLSLAFVLLFGRAPASFLCNYQAEHLLNIGEYTSALHWLDYAQQLNPSIDKLATYNLERGQAWHYLYPDKVTVNSMAYLASYYRQQNDFLSAYQELQSAWQRGPHERWLIDEINITLQLISEQPHPLNGTPIERIHAEEPSLSWLNAILQVDPDNVYAHYMIGRLHYEIHDFTTSEAQMISVIHLSTNSDIQSSAYTYLGLSKASEGKYLEAHNDMFRAQDLDPEFRNNTAREEISGLR